MAESADSHAKNMPLYIAMVVYMLMLVGIGIIAYQRKRSATSSEGGVAAHFGGNFSPLVLVFTTFSSVFSGYTVTGIPTECHANGFMCARWFVAIACIGIAMLTYYPRLRRIAAVRRYISPCSFVKDRFGTPVLTVSCALLCCAPQLIYLTAQFVSFAATLEGLTLGLIGFTSGVILFAVVMIGMEMLGGINSVVLSDVVQAVIMIAGFCVLPIVIIIHFGTFASQASPECGTCEVINSTFTVLPSLPPQQCTTSGCGGIMEDGCIKAGCLPYARDKHGVSFYDYPPFFEAMGTFFFIANNVAFPLNPHMLQRVNIASSDLAVRIVVFVLLLAGFIAVTPGMLIGINKAVFEGTWPERSRSVSAFAAMGEELLKKGPVEYVLVVMMVTSSLAAIMSTADSVVVGVSATLSIDLYQGMYNPGASAANVVFFGTCISIFYALFGGLFALYVHVKKTSFALLLTFQNGILIQAVPTYIFGLFADPSPISLVVGIFSGLLVMVVVASNASTTNPLFQLMAAPAWGFVANLAMFGIVSIVSVLRSSSRFRPGELSAAKILEITSGVQEPKYFVNACCILLGFLSISWYAEGGTDVSDSAIMGVPLFAWRYIIIFIVMASVSFYNCSTWMPPAGKEEAGETVRPDDNSMVVELPHTARRLSDSSNVPLRA